MKNRRLRQLLRNRTTIIGFAITVALVVVGAFADVLSPQDPLAQSISAKLEGPSAEHLLGTDRFGRDVLSRIIHASRVSLIIGVGSIVLGAAIGTVFGIYATLRGGIWESILVNATDVLMSVPTLLLCLMLLFVLGQGLGAVIIAIGIGFAPRFARLSRGPTLALRDGELVEAATALGSRHLRIALKHVLPNVIGPIAVMAVLWVATAIRIEASLSFLGFGVQPPLPTFGGMVQEGFQSLVFKPFAAIYPGLAIVVVVLGFNLLGDGLRDVFDARG